MATKLGETTNFSPSFFWMMLVPRSGNKDPGYGMKKKSGSGTGSEIQH